MTSCSFLSSFSSLPGFEWDGKSGLTFDAEDWGGIAVLRFIRVSSDPCAKCVQDMSKRTSHTDRNSHTDEVK